MFEFLTSTFSGLIHALQQSHPGSQEDLKDYLPRKFSRDSWSFRDGEAANSEDEDVRQAEGVRAYDEGSHEGQGEDRPPDYNEDDQEPEEDTSSIRYWLWEVDPLLVHYDHIFREAGSINYLGPPAHKIF